MCRMLGIMPDRNTTPDFSIVRSFRNLASCGKVPRGSSPGHSDGWGIVTWELGVPKYLAREPTNAFSDSKFEQACALGEKKRSKFSAHSSPKESIAGAEDRREYSSVRKRGLGICAQRDDKETRSSSHYRQSLVFSGNHARIREKRRRFSRAY